MTSPVTYTNQRPIALSIRRGALLRCPCCGEGRLFRSYLKPAGDCSSCGEVYGDMRTDDAAPWLTILIVGHIVGPLIVMSERNFAPPFWVQIGIFIPATLLLTLWLLPHAKGALLGLMWALRLRGTEAQ
jgi:uncharacterized protein (DUF983 family)